MDVLIRQAVLSDLESILRLNKKLFDYETKFNDEYDLEWTYSEAGKKYFKERLENQSTIILVAESNNEIVGYILSFIDSYPFRKENPIAEIENMFVATDYRGKGIGKSLIQETKRMAKERGVKRIKVVAVATNSAAIKFYKTNGLEDFDVVLEEKLD